MKLTIADVEKIATLARLELTPEEINLYQEQLSAVLDYAEKLNKLDIERVPPTSSAVAMENVMREDAIEPSLSGDDVLFNAPHKAKDQFKIQSVLDEE